LPYTALAICLLTANEDDIWAMVAKYYINYIQTGDLFLLKLNMMDMKYIKYTKPLPMFYQEVIAAFNKAKGTSQEDFSNTILDQPIWGNDFIRCNTSDGKNGYLMFKAWIECKLIKIKNLRFINGILDDQYIFNVVRNHSNILAEINILRKALKTYQMFIGSHEPDNDTHIPKFQFKGKAIEDFKAPKSKPLYLSLVGLKSSAPEKLQQYWEGVLRLYDIDFQKVFEIKVKRVKDKKLAEFNFKILHNILPCNANLFKWNKGDTKMCPLCKVEEDIPHMLHACIFAEKIWVEFRFVTGFDIELQDIVLGGRLNFEYSFVVSCVAYLIYKNWLIHSINGKKRENNGSLRLMRPDLKYRSAVFRHLHWHLISDIINDLVDM
jgi:hypothetical protein